MSYTLEDLKTIRRTYPLGLSTSIIYRTLGVMEAILTMYDIFKPYQTFQYKDIEYTSYKYLIFKKCTKIRKQTYEEHILENFDNFLIDVENGKILLK